jgi:dynein heavy chain 2
LACVWSSSLSEQERKKSLIEWTNYLGVNEFDFCTQFENEFDLAKFSEDVITKENLVIGKLNSNCTYWITDGNNCGLSAIEMFFHPRIVSAQSDAYVKEVEMAIRLGTCIVITDMPPDGIHSWLYPLLQQEYQLVHGRRLLSLGDKQIEVHDNFRLFLYSSSTTWNIPDDLKGYCRKLTWSTTTESLSSALLKIITSKDSPELLKQLEEVTLSEKSLRSQLALVESSLLQELSSSKGNIMENQALLDSLTSAKEKSRIVSDALDQSAKLKDQLRSQQQMYTPILKVSTAQYFSMRKLQEMHPHYRFSLVTFLSWFTFAVENHPAPPQTCECPWES